MPLLARGLTGVTGIPLGLIVLLALYGFTLHRAMLDRSGFIVGARSVAQA